MQWMAWFHKIYRFESIGHALVVLLCLTFPGPAQAQESTLAIENELLLDLRLEGRPLGVTILGYQRDGEFLVSLEELMEGLQFPISVEASSGRAGGWFIEEEREFLLDMPNGQVLSDGKAHLPGTDVVRFGGDIFVTTQALQRWFPLQLDPILRQLTLNVQPTEAIPLQARLARLNRQPRTLGFGRREPVLPLQANPYRLLGPHSTDLRLNYSNVRRDENDDPDLSLTYSLLSRGDLGWMTSTLAVSGRDDDELTGGRLKLERTAFEGPLNLNHVEVGDVNPRQASSNSRGVLIRGGGTQRGETELFAGESIDLRGDIPPDWDVELYRNGLLIDSQVVGDDAQYEFLEVPLEFGENRFEIVLYGPFGDEQREEQVVFVGRNQLGFGEVSYELAALQSGRNVFDVEPSAGQGDRDSGRYVANVNLGLSCRATANFGLDSLVEDGERVENYGAGLNLNFNRFQTSANYRFLETRQNQLSASLRSRLAENTSLNLRYAQFNTSGLEQEAIPDNRSLWNASLSLSSRFFNQPFNLSGSHFEREFSSSANAVLGTTLDFRNLGRFSKTLSYSREDSRGLDEELTEQSRGSISASTRLRPWQLRAGFDYTISPETEFGRFTSSATLRIDSRMTMNFDFNHAVASSFTVYRGGFNWGLEYFQVSPQVIYDSNERWAGLISLSTSLSPRPGRRLPEFERFSQAGSGAARARVFLDHDGDGAFGSGDEPLPAVRIDAVQAWRHGETGADGQAYITRLNAHRQTDIAIDAGTLPDFELQPAQPGRSIVPRPGSWSTIDFPVARASELEGHVYGRFDDGQISPQERVLVKLIDSNDEIVTQQRTAFDGFYLFSGVLPGNYQLRLSDSDQGRVMESPGSVSVGANGGVIRELDFLLRPETGRSLIERPISGGSPSAPFAPTGDITAPVDEVISDEGLAPASEVGAFEPEPSAEKDAALPTLEAIQPPTAGDWRLQLGAFSERANAARAWQNLMDTQGSLMENYEPWYQSGGNLTRLLTRPGVEEAVARELCNDLQAADQDCLVREIAE